MRRVLALIAVAVSYTGFIFIATYQLTGYQIVPALLAMATLPVLLGPALWYAYRHRSSN